MSCFPPQNCFELASKRFPKYAVETGVAPSDLLQETRQDASLRENRCPCKLLDANRLMQENQSGQNCPQIAKSTPLPVSGKRWHGEGSKPPQPSPSHNPTGGSS